MRHLPIDSSAANFAVAEEPRRLTDFNTKEPVVNENGEQQFAVKLLAQTSGEISIINVKVFGLTGNFNINESVKVSGLVGQPAVDKGGRAIVYFNADRIESATKAKAA